MNRSSHVAVGTDRARLAIGMLHARVPWSASAPRGGRAREAKTDEHPRLFQGCGRDPQYSHGAMCIEAELAVGRWRATDCVVLLARAATHRKASGSPSFTAWAHSPRARGASAGYLPGCPFTGTPFTASFSRYHVTRKSEWRRLRFPCSPTQSPTWRFATHTRLRQ